jgi:hypothetical protein
LNGIFVRAAGLTAMETLSGRHGQEFGFLARLAFSNPAR